MPTIEERHAELAKEVEVELGQMRILARVLDEIECTPPNHTFGLEFRWNRANYAPSVVARFRGKSFWIGGGEDYGRPFPSAKQAADYLKELF